MKFTVEVEDFYLEEDEIEVSLKNWIKSEVSSQIRTSIQEKVDKIIQNSYKEEIENKLKSRVDILLGEVYSTTKLKAKYSSDPEISIEEYIFQQFNEVKFKDKTEDKIQSSIKTLVKSNSEKIVEEMKQRYDMLFASQLVQKMNEVGMLKNEVAQLLLKKDETIS